MEINKVVPKDQAIRERIINEVSSNFLVEAGAGSGKTTILVKRIISQLLKEDINIEQIVAITFTKKAAAELKERLIDDLEKSVIESEDELEKQKLKKAIEDFPRCYIGTIHAFCGKLLRERPIEAQVSPVFKELDDIQEKLFRKEIWYKFLGQLSEEDEQILKEIRENKELGITDYIWEGTYHQLLDYLDVEIAKKEDLDTQLFFDERITEGLNELYEKAKQIKEIIEAEKCSGKGITTPSTLTKFITKNEQQNLSLSDKKILLEEGKKAFENLTTTATGKKIQENNQSYKEIIDDAVDSVTYVLSEIECLDKREYYYQGMALIKRACDFYQSEKNKKGYLGFQDLLLKTKWLLEYKPETRVYFGNKYKSILVDEFQDTDPIQAEILKYLTEDSIERGIRKGSLFVVGDPKQAIYRFRRADINVYEDFKTYISKHGGEVLKLSSNFRSEPEIVDWVNERFEEIFSRETLPYQVHYEAMDKKTGNGASEEVVGVRKLAIRCRNEKTALEDVSEEVAKFIQQEIYQGNKKPNDFMILTSKKYEVEYFERALNDRGIKTKSTGKFSLDCTVGIGSILCLLKYLESRDGIALIALFKECFGVSDQDLYETKKAIDTIQDSPWKVNFKNLIWYLDRRKDKLEGMDSLQIPSSVLEAYKKLMIYENWKRIYPFTVLLYKFIEDSGLITNMMTRGDESYGKLYHILGILESIECQEGLTISQAILKIQQLLEESVEELSSIQGSDVNAVRIMNVHKAKGLQAKVVILASPKQKSESMPTVYVERSKENKQSIGYFTFNNYYKGKTSIKLAHEKWTQKCNKEKRYLEAEQKRLQYVAATRAEKLLLVVSCEGALHIDEACEWKDLYKDLQPYEWVECKPNNDHSCNTSSKNGLVEKIDFKIENNWIRESRKSNYIFTHPTEDKHIKDHAEVVGGGSAAWGTLVHEVLEYMVGNRDKEQNQIDIIVKNVCRQSVLYNKIKLEEDKQELYSKLEETLLRFRNSEVWQRIVAADEAFTEVPFALQVNLEQEPWKDLIIAEAYEGKKVFLKGVIDLVIKEGDRWTILDYKTDHLKTKADIALRTKSYEGQLRTYVEVWKQLTDAQQVDWELVFLYQLSKQDVL